MRTLSIATLILLIGSVSASFAQNPPSAQTPDFPDFSSWPAESGTCNDGAVTVVVHGILTQLPVTEFIRDGTVVATMMAFPPFAVLSKLPTYNDGKPVFLSFNDGVTSLQKMVLALRTALDPDPNKSLAAFLSCVEKENTLVLKLHDLLKDNTAI